MAFTEEQLEKVGVSLQLYNTLSDEEKEAVDNILHQMIDEGDTEVYEQLYYADYKEIPVSFSQFISDDNYLGKSTRQGQFIYPFWREECAKIVASEDVEVALSGAIGIGKTTIACLMMAYVLYRVMCMRDPQAFFGLSPGSRIVVAFLNNTLGSSYGVGYETFQSFLKESPWFLKHGTLVGRSDPYYVPGDGFGIIVGSKVQHTLGRHVIAALLDEVSFAPGQNVNYEKSKVMELYRNIRRRMNSRFTIQGKNYGKLFLVSSKSTEASFLESYIADQVKNGYPIYVVDQPIWVVKAHAYGKERFQVAVGNKFIPSRIVRGSNPKEIADACEAYKKQGMRIIDVPVEEMQAFDQDIDKALQDIAGISTSVVTKVFSMQRLQRCIDENYQNPFSSEVITLGLNDEYQISDFFHPEVIPEFILGAPTFIHLDASVSGDRTGLSAVAVVGTRQVVDAFSEDKTPTDELVCQQVFTVGIQPPSDSEISFEKTRRFIYYLKDEVGLNIKAVSTDGFQSVDTRQILATKGFETKYTSLDRTPDGYDSLKSGINDKRIVLLRGCNELWDELTDLERDNLTRKYDHPVGGKKDEADSLAGAYFDALQYKDEFIFFHPNDYDYEGLNDNTSEQQKYVSDILKSITIDKAPSKITTTLSGVTKAANEGIAPVASSGVAERRPSVEDIFASMTNDSDILLL